ncbi:helix-turn-helix domain-containing protein [Lapidilactobacillus gannanensis]|uniref:Helix-turn-helix domain-containing protein n=1 Tax=Lapidilactobacillus gannanensis TaxID=2486002 RepID=A0ABW4BM42_9LACO|nr:helix-turn-helix transcriptional regulator [Lapidilactobacillus gannanensis]
MNTGESLKMLRQQQGMSQTELSIKSGVLQTTISAIERGTDPTGRTLVSLAKALNVSTDKLLKFESKQAANH